MFAAGVKIHSSPVSAVCLGDPISNHLRMKKNLLQTFHTFSYASLRAAYVVCFFFLLFSPDLASAQSVVVTGTENNVPISRVKLAVGTQRFEQVNPTGNNNPLPADVPVLIESVVLENGEEVYVTSRRPEVVNPNPVLGTNRISPTAVQIIRSDKPSLGHMSPEFLEGMEEVVSTADLRSYWSIEAQPSIPRNESFIDLRYPFPSSGYIMFSERNGNSSIDFIPLGIDGRPIPGATTVQIRGYQWNTGVNHSTDNPGQKQWLVVFSASLFNTFQPISGVRIVSINEPDGKLVFFVGKISAAPDQAGPILNLNESKAVVNVLDNDELNDGPVQLFDIELSVITPFPANTLIFNPDGTVDVPAGTAPGVYTMTYQIKDIVGGETDQGTVTVRVFEMLPEANDDNGGEVSAEGATALLNVLDNDFLNGEAATLENVSLTEVSNTSNGYLTLNTDGTVDVKAGAPFGQYQLTYQICDLVDTSKCDTATVTVYVGVKVIDAVNDDFGVYNQNGVIGNVFINDRINGIPVSANQVIAKITDNGGLSGIVLEETGVLRISGNVAPGSYVLEYELAEALNPENKDRAEIRFVVGSGTITLVNDAAVTNQGQPVKISVLLNDNTESGSFDLASLEIAAESSNGTLSINPDGSITYSPEASFSGVDRFTYSVCDSTDGSACGTAVVTVTVKPISIALTKAVDKTTVSVGETLTFTITLTNNSEFAVENIRLSDILPDLLLYTSSSPAPAEADTWIFPRLASGESVSMTIDALAVTSGSTTNTATLTAGTFETSATSPSVTIGDLPVDLRISKTSHAVEIYQGNEFEYEIVIENVGSSLASGVTVTDVLPSGLTYVSNSYTATSSEITATFASNSNQLTWTVASLPADESLKIILKVRADEIGVKTNTVEVKAAPQEEITPTDNIAQDTNEVRGLFIPNVITPGDKDNKNDTFVIPGIERFANSRLVIFNRLGNHVFEADNYQNNWDATGLSSGTYYYVLELTNSSNAKQTFKGWVQVIKD
jgi:uncharacterized repeat protein (TIGR01451 family)/gliding motility-associated-like protein